MRAQPIPFVQALRAAMLRHADRTALYCRGERLSYGELLDRAGALCDLIVARGVAPGERIALIGERGSADYVGLLAILLAGCAYVPLNPGAPQARNAYIVRHSGAVGLLTDTACAAAFALPLDPDSALRFAFDSGTGAALYGGASRPASRATAAGMDFIDGAYIMYTSGTTGQPKGVPITGANLGAYLASLDACFVIDAGDRVAHLSDLSFDLSMHEILLAWAHGAALHRIPRTAALLASRYVEEEGITVWVSVPSTISLAYKAGTLAPGSMGSLLLAFFCGEALPLSTVRQFAAAAPRAEMVNLWGPTEGTVSLSYFRIDPLVELPEIVPIGVAYAGQELMLAGADGMPAAPGETGELWASGSQITRGYWASAQLNAERFPVRDGRRWYRTGDLAAWDGRHGFCYKGRVDRQIKFKGYRIEPQECESALREIGGWEGVCVIAWPRSDSGAALGLLAFVEAEDVDEQAVRLRLSQILPAYMVPGRILTHTLFPLTASGKLDVLALEARAGDYAASNRLAS